MSDLSDYSGKFNAEAKLQDFSREAILRLWRLGSLTYMLLGGLWFDVVKDKVGVEKALEWEKEVWLKRGGCENDIRVSMDALNISGNDVATLLKAFQLLCRTLPNVRQPLRQTGRRHVVKIIWRHRLRLRQPVHRLPPLNRLRSPYSPLRGQHKPRPHHHKPQQVERAHHRDNSHHNAHATTLDSLSP